MTSPPPELSNFCAQVCGTKAQYRNSGSSKIINSNSPSAPSRGPTLLSLCTGKEKKKEQNERDSPDTNSRGRLKLPLELRGTPSRVSPRSDGGQTRYLPPGGHGGAEADRGQRWRSCCPKKSCRSSMNPKRRRPHARYHLHRCWDWTYGRGRRPQGSIQHGDHLPRTPSRRGWHHRRT